VRLCARAASGLPQVCVERLRGAVADRAARLKKVCCGNVSDFVVTVPPPADSN
jgi:hypothetical protein